MNEYERIALAIRKKVSKVTLQQQREILKLYESAIDSLAVKITKAKDKGLTQRWLIDYKKELERARKELANELNKSITGYTTKAARIGTEAEQQIMSKIFEYAGIDTGNHFTTMFSLVQDKVIKDIISGNLYKDKKTLSSRIWNYSNEFNQDIQYIINQGLLEKKSAIELAKDLEMFVKDPAKRGWDWSKIYPRIKSAPVDYNAMRLARTSINHAYQNSSIQSSNINPFVEGIRWRSAEIHGRTCDLCIERANTDQFGLGVGIFPKDQVPLDHPNGLCTMLPHIIKSLDDIADELKSWLDGNGNPTLDLWYNKYGNYFAFKKL